MLWKLQSSTALPILFLTLFYIRWRSIQVNGPKMVCNGQVLLVCLLTCTAFVINHHQSLSIQPCWVPFFLPGWSSWSQPCAQWRCPEKQVVNMQWVSQVGTWQCPRKQQGTTRSDTGFGLAPSQKGKSARQAPTWTTTSWKIEVDKSLEKKSHPQELVQRFKENAILKSILWC